MPRTLSVSFFGYGYWGKNLLRTLMNEPQARVKWACDISPERLKQIRADYPQLAVTHDYATAMRDSEVEAVVLATPAETHVPLAIQALEYGKHVFVEKPMGTDVQEADRLAAVVRNSGKTFQVGHIFEYAEPVQVLRDWIRTGRLGNVRYVTGNRSSLGPRIRTDCNIVWDYAIHDLYILMYLFQQEPERVAARGQCTFYKNIEDTVFLDLHFPGGTWAVLHSSWAAPLKRRDITFVGDRAMAVYDETREDKLVLYDCGYSPAEGYDSWGNWNWRLFDRGKEVAKTGQSQPLATEIANFLECASRGASPVSNVEDGLRTIRVLNAVNRSLKTNGSEVSLK
ncbi:MAG: Gfo/Idh/MocA family oxidoreductase [Syntrophobacteraceae bacterium]